MPLIYLDGVEKAGKTSICRLLQEKYSATYHHFGLPPEPPSPFDLVFHGAMVEHVERALAGELIVWDRGWVSDHIYGSLLLRQTRLSGDAWLGEWLYGRVFRTIGVTAILTGPSLTTLESLRSDDDQPVSIRAERVGFYTHGIRFRYDYSAPSYHDTRWQEEMADALVKLAVSRCMARPLSPPDYVGPPRPKVLFVGESRKDDSRFPGAYAPFTSLYTTQLARTLGDLALQCGWTNADVVTDALLTDPRLVVACGNVARERVYPVRKDALCIPHPSWLYRWGKAAGRIPRIESALLRAVCPIFGRAREEKIATAV